MRGLGAFGGEEPDGLSACAASPARACGSAGTAAAVQGQLVVCLVWCSTQHGHGRTRPLNVVGGEMELVLEVRSVG